MILSPQQFIDIRKLDSGALKDVVFTKFAGNRGPCIASVDHPMTADEAQAYCEQIVADATPRPVDEKPANGKVFDAAGA